MKTKKNLGSTFVSRNQASYTTMCKLHFMGPIKPIKNMNMDHRPYMKKGEVTAAMLWVANEQNDKGADENNIEVGWQ